MGGGDGSAGCVVSGIDVDAGAGPFLTINPMDSAEFFGTVGMSTGPVPFTVSNLGSALSGAFTVTLTGSSSFHLTGNSCTNPLPARQTCQVAVTFSPLEASAMGESTGTLTISAVGIPGCTFTISLSGSAH